MVRIGGAECPVTSATSTEIVCTVPTHAPGRSFVVVANAAGDSSEEVEFLFELAVTNVDFGDASTSLSLGGGIQITVQGSGFQSGPNNASIELTSFGAEQYILGVYSLNSSSLLQGNFTLSMRGLTTPPLDVMASSEEVNSPAHSKVVLFLFSLFVTKATLFFSHPKRFSFIRWGIATQVIERFSR
jgi:hypothetical protein